MSDKALDYFGEILIKNVRDLTLYNWDKIIRGEMKGNTAKKVTELLREFTDDQKDSVMCIIEKAIDEELHNFLVMVDDCEDINVEVEYRGEKKYIRELSDGLAGELYTDDGWIFKYSKR